MKILTSPHLDYVDNMRLTRFHWILLLGITLAQILDGFDYQIIAFTLPGFAAEFKLNPGQAGAVPSAQNVGLLLGAIIFSNLADRFGRKPVFQFVLLTYALGSLISAFAPTYETLLAARFVTGFGIGAEFPVAFALLAELSPKVWRAKFIPVGPFMYGVGWVVAGLASIYIVLPFGWRAAFFVGVLPALMIIYVRTLIPESPRYLLLQGRVDEATRVVQQLARTAGEDFTPPPGQQFQVETAARVPMGPYRKTVGLFGVMIGLTSLTLFGLNAWLPQIFASQGYSLLRSFQYTIIVTAVTPFSQVIGAWFQDRVTERRQALYILGWTGTALSIGFGLAIYLKAPIELAIALQVLGGLAGGTVAVYYTMGTELFPTEIRSQAIGWATALGRTGAVIGPLLLGLLVQGGLPFATILVFWFIPALAAYFIPFFGLKGETAMRSLEVTAQVVAEQAEHRPVAKESPTT